MPFGPAVEPALGLLACAGETGLDEGAIVLGAALALAAALALRTGLAFGVETLVAITLAGKALVRAGLAWTGRAVAGAFTFRARTVLEAAFRFGVDLIEPFAPIGRALMRVDFPAPLALRAAGALATDVRLVTGFAEVFALSGRALAALATDVRLVARFTEALALTDWGRCAPFALRAVAVLAVDLRLVAGVAEALALRAPVLATVARLLTGFAEALTLRVPAWTAVLRLGTEEVEAFAFVAARLAAGRALRTGVAFADAAVPVRARRLRARLVALRLRAGLAAG